MAPSLTGQDNRFFPEIEDYDKILTEMPKATRMVTLGIFYITSKDFDLYRFTEYQLIDGSYDYCIVGEFIDTFDPDYQEAEIKRLRAAQYNPFEIGEEIFKLGIGVAGAPPVVFRVAYCKFDFYDKSRSPAKGMQIRGVFTHTDHTGGGVATWVYLYLVDKYNYLACDNVQTIKGSTLWAYSMRKHYKVEIYDTLNNVFIEELGDNACGVNGFIPWDIGKLAAYRLKEWGDRKLNFTPGACTHIVNIVTK